MTRTIIDNDFLDVLTSHIYPSRNSTSMYASVPYETMHAGKTLSIINTNWAKLLFRWIKGENRNIFSAPLYRYLTENAENIVLFNHAFEAYHMHIVPDLRTRLKEILDRTGRPLERNIILTHNRDIFLKHNGWENNMNIVEYNALFHVYYSTRQRVEGINVAKRNKHFTTLCGTVRKHRTDLHAFLRIEDLLDKTHYTYNSILADPKWTEIYNNEQVYCEAYHDHLRFTPVFRSGSFDLGVHDIEERTLQHNALPMEYWIDSYIHLITETCYGSGDYGTGSARDFFTEKSMKVYDNYQIPMVISTPGMVEYHRKQGYDVFDDIVDHSYDTVEDTKHRFDLIAKEIRRLAGIPLPQLHELYMQHTDRLQNNRENLHRHYLRNQENAELALQKVIYG
jgi:hypothetical protein